MAKKREYRQTSKEGEAHIKPFKPNHKAKILVGLERLKIGGTFEEISLTSGMKDSQVWKRLSEMEKDGTIFNTGITRKLKSGVHGIVWQKVGLKPIEPISNPKTKEQVRANKILKEIKSVQQPSLF